MPEAVKIEKWLETTCENSAIMKYFLDKRRAEGKPVTIRNLTMDAIGRIQFEYCEQPA